MARLAYSAITSLDGFIEDESGSFAWAAPDATLHAYLNELTRPVGTFLYGRRMYETMAVWETIGTGPEGEGADPIEIDFAELWRAADKIVYSRTLDAVDTARTRLEREFDPAAMRRLKETAERDLAVAGPTLAAHAFAAGLVDRVDLVVFPISVGGGKPGLPDGVRDELDPIGERSFASGVVHRAYARR